MSARRIYHEPETFQWWREQRQAIAPYLSELYPQIEPLLADAETIVDLCGGEGHTHEMLSADFSPRMTTVDLDQDALARLKTRHQEATTVHADSNKLPFDDDSFDAAIAINGLGGADARQTAKEAKRVLRPGGILIFLHDLPHNMRKKAIERWEVLPAAARDNSYIFPYFNQPSGNVDIFAYVRRDDMEDLAASERISAIMAVDRVRHTLGEDWINKVYGDTFEVGTYAKLFRRVVQEIRTAGGEERVFLEPPLAPEMKQTMLELILRLGLKGEVLDLEVDTRTQETHLIRGRDVSSLYVDEMTVPRVVYKSETSPNGDGTKVKGKTPVFVGRKP